MKKTIKIVSITLAVILLLLIISPFIVAMVVDPNDYKPEISKLVKEQTGRTLTINGDLNYSIFPWLGISLGELQLSNSTIKGFSKKPFAKIKSADVKVKIMPLFSSKIEVEKIVLDGLTLSLEKNKQGVSNWDDLIAKSDKKTPNKNSTPKTKQATPPKKTDDTNSSSILPAIAGIELINANVDWNDRQLGQHYQLRDFNFTTGIIANDTPTDINISFSFKANKPEVSGKASLSATLQFNIENKSVQLSNFEFTKNINQKIQKPNNIEAKLSADSIKVNLTKETASVSKLKIAVLGIELNTSLTATKILSNLKVKGTLSTNQINPKALLDTLQIQLPKMADSKVLNKAKVDVAFNATLNKVNLSKVKLQFDDSNLSGNISIANFSAPKLRYKLHFDQINIDRYLPPPVTTKPKTVAAKKSVTKVTQATEQNLPIPVELLRTLDIKGSFTLGKVTVVKLHSSDIKLNVLAKDGVLRAYPISAKMYQGQYNGDITLNVKKKFPTIVMNEKISGVSFAPLVTDYMGEDYISGHGSASIKLTTKGLKISEFTKNLNGSIAFNIKDAKVKYLKPTNLLGNEVNQLVSKYTKKPFKKKSGTDNPDVFTMMKGTFNIIKGIAHNDDFITKSRDVNLTGKGYVDLVKQTVKYRLKIHLQKPKTGDKEFDQYLKTHPISNPIHGPFTNLSYNNADIGHVVSGFYKAKLQKKIDFEKKKLNAKKNKAVNDAKERLKRDIKKKLGDFFK